MANRLVYKVIFANQGKVYEVFARKVCSGELYGFVEVEEILFGEKTTLLVDPSEEQLKLEFNGVNRFHIPFHSVIRIDEVEREGKGKILQMTSQKEDLAAVPHPLIKPDKGTDRT